MIYDRERRKFPVTTTLSLLNLDLDIVVSRLVGFSLMT